MLENSNPRQRVTKLRISNCSGGARGAQLAVANFKPKDVIIGRDGAVSGFFVSQAEMQAADLSAGDYSGEDGADSEFFVSKELFVSKVCDSFGGSFGETQVSKDGETQVSKEFFVSKVGDSFGEKTARLCDDTQVSIFLQRAGGAPKRRRTPSPPSHVRVVLILPGMRSIRVRISLNNLCNEHIEDVEQEGLPDMRLRSIEARQQLPYGTLNHFEIFSNWTGRALTPQQLDARIINRELLVVAPRRRTAAAAAESSSNSSSSSSSSFSDS